MVLLPGSVAELTADGCTATPPGADLDEFFANKEQHLREYQARQRPVIEAAKASWRHPEIDVLEELKRRIEPLLEESIYLAKGVGGPVRFDLVGYDGETVESIVVDFPDKRGAAVRRREGAVPLPDRAGAHRAPAATPARWTGSTRSSSPAASPPRESASTTSSSTRSSSACREERLQYAEGWYDEHERASDAEDITLGDWVVQRRCPHLKADLTRFGVVDGDELTCQLHGWRFDLSTGRCLTSVGHKIRARRASEAVPAGQPASETTA